MVKIQKMNDLNRNKNKISILKNIWKGSITNLIILIIVILLFIIFSFKSPDFLKFTNISTILASISSIGIVCLGQTLLLLTGNYDISVGSVVGLAGVLMAKFFNIFEVTSIGNSYLVILLILAICGAIGFINGFIVTKIKVNALITTLAMLWILLGVSMAVSGGKDISIDNPLSGIVIGARYLKIISIPILILIIFYVIFYLILKITVFGKYIYAIGSNDTAIKFSGVNVDGMRIVIFTIASIFSGISGILLSLKLHSGQAIYGESYPILSIALCVLGGTLISGGQGGVLGTLLAVLFLTLLRNGLDYSGIPNYAQQVIVGIIFLIAFYVSGYLSSRKYMTLK
jgi:ribose transport system permease protein